MSDFDVIRAALGKWQLDAFDALSRVETELADWKLKERALTDYFADASRRAEAAQARVAELEADKLKLVDALGEQFDKRTAAEAALADMTAQRDALSDLAYTQGVMAEAAETEAAKLREDIRLVVQWFQSKPWEGEPDARDFGGGPYSPDHAAPGVAHKSSCPWLKWAEGKA